MVCADRERYHSAGSPFTVMAVIKVIIGKWFVDFNVSGGSKQHEKILGHDQTMLSLHNCYDRYIKHDM
jgi:hypothetical protein